MSCKNCRATIHVPDDRTGLIHTHGFYVCQIEYKKGDVVKVAEQ